MRFVIVIAFMLTAACAKGIQSEAAPTAECTDFVSPYMVEYIDGSLVKSEVSQCGQVLTAKALDQSGRTMTAESLTIQLKDATTGIPYLTGFTGQ